MEEKVEKKEDDIEVSTDSSGNIDSSQKNEQADKPKLKITGSEGADIKQIDGNKIILNKKFKTNITEPDEEPEGQKTVSEIQKTPPIAPPPNDIINESSKTPPTISNSKEKVDTKQPSENTAPEVTTPTPEPATKTAALENHPPQTPPKISNDQLGHIGPRGNSEQGLRMPTGQDTTPQTINPDDVSSDLDSQKQQRTDSNTENQINPNTKIQLPEKVKMPKPEEADQIKEEEEKKRAAREEMENQEYERMNALQKFVRSKQQRKLVKKMDKKVDKLIGPIERAILKNYFLTVDDSIIIYQNNLHQSLKSLLNKKTINRDDSQIKNLGKEIELFDGLVLKPALTQVAFKESIKAFRNFWLSWSIELWWWTIIMAVFDLIIIFPIFFLMPIYVIGGPGNWVLRLIQRRNKELYELLGEIKKAAKPKG